MASRTGSEVFRILARHWLKTLAARWSTPKQCTAGKSGLAFLGECRTNVTGSLVPLCFSYIAISLYRVVQQVLCANKWSVRISFGSGAWTGGKPPCLTRGAARDGRSRKHSCFSSFVHERRRQGRKVSECLVRRKHRSSDFACKEQPAQRQDQRRRRDSHRSSDFASKEQAEVIRVELAGTSSAVSVRPCCDVDRNGCSLEYLRIISVVTIRK